MTKLSPEQVMYLNAPLSSAAVKTREQGKSTLSYVEAWHVINEANRIFGFDAWDRETVECRCVAERERKIGQGQYQRDGWGVTYIAKVRVSVDGIVREGSGAGHGIDADLGLAHESAIKEAESDAMKRAFMTFGNPFGLALYDKTQANVEDVSKPAETKAAEKPISAAEQKRQLVEIDKDLIDVHSEADLKRCAAIWQELAKRDGWSRDYKLAAKEKFDAKRTELNNRDVVDDIEDTFPGSRVVNETIREHHVLEAGE